MSHDYAGLDLDDLTPRQLRKLLKGSIVSSMTRSRRKGAQEEVGDEDESDTKENDDLVNLHREKKGDDKAPKVTRDDLPRGVTMPESEDEPKKKDKSKPDGKA